MKQSIQFMYDGVSSEDMGVFIAWNGKGLFEDIFLPERTIIEKKIPNREKPYFQRVEHAPLSFSLSFAIADWESDETLRKLARWFFQPNYRPLIFSSNPNRVFYAMFEGSSKLMFNGLKEGYVELNIRCDSPYGYSFEQTKENLEFRDINVGANINLDNTNFNSGYMTNMKTTEEGLTIDTVATTWGIAYATNNTWGGIT